MADIKILDCTLRDGGFVNNWEFGYSCINNIVNRLNNAHVDIIEIGYIRNYVSYNEDSTQFPNVTSIDQSLINKKYDSMIVALMDFGDCTIDEICDRKDSIIDGIRITFRKERIDEALLLSRKIKEKGYKIFLQPVAITDYNGSDTIKLIEKINHIDPYAVCIVDTYGFMNRHDLEKYFYLFDSSLNQKIALGYHSHNNYQLSYANAISLIEMSTKRCLIIDSSTFGMGKGAGNLNTELITAYLNTNYEYHYGINDIVEIISIYLEDERNKNFWGYGLRYFLAANSNVHHNYVKYLLDKKTLTVKSINKILEMIDDEKKTRYDEEYIEKLYEVHQNKLIDDESVYTKLRRFIGEREVLILAPGNTLSEYKRNVNDYALQKNPCVISVNHIIDLYKCDILFISNAIRYSQMEVEMESMKEKIDVIATSNISFASVKPDYVVKYQELLMNDAKIKDSAVIMLMKLLYKLGYHNVSIAGFDGFTEDKNDKNYYSKGKSLGLNAKSATENIKDALEHLPQDFEIKFITPSLYEKEEER